MRPAKILIRLIWVFTGRSCPKVHFLTVRLILYCGNVRKNYESGINLKNNGTSWAFSCHFALLMQAWYEIFSSPYSVATSTILAASIEKVPSSMRKMCGYTSSCACAESHPGVYSLLKTSIVSNDFVGGQWRPWSNCVDLSLRCPHMPEGTFSQGADGPFLYDSFANVRVWVCVHMCVCKGDGLAY